MISKSPTPTKPFHRRLIEWTVGFCVMSVLAACSQSNLPIASLSDVNAEMRESYQLAAGDGLRITVFDEPMLTGDYEVGVGGDLALPLIASISAAGKTPKVVAEEITNLLKAGDYVLYPRVSVEIIDHRPFYILGEVNKPGEYPYNGDLSFEQAVAKAGGFTARANRKTVILRRQDWDSGKRVVLDGGTLLISPGDTITIQEAFF